MKNLVVTEEIWKEGNMYTGYCPELDIASCGRDIEKAIKTYLSHRNTVGRNRKTGDAQDFFRWSKSLVSLTFFIQQLIKQINISSLRD